MPRIRREDFVSEIERAVEGLDGEAVACAAEAAGLVVFEEKEEQAPLPKRLAMSDTGLCDVCADMEPRWVVATVTGVGVYSTHPGREWQRRVLTEMVDAYNNKAKAGDLGGDHSLPPPGTDLPHRLAAGPLAPTGAWIGERTDGHLFVCRDDAALPLAHAIVDVYNKVQSGELVPRVRLEQVLRRIDAAKEYLAPHETVYRILSGEEP